MKKRKPPILLVAILLLAAGAVAFMNYQTVFGGPKPGEPPVEGDGRDHAQEGRELAPPSEVQPGSQDEMKAKLGEATGKPPGPKMPNDGRPKVERPGVGEPRAKPDDNAISSQWYRDQARKAGR